MREGEELDEREWWSGCLSVLECNGGVCVCCDGECDDDVCVL